ncbi:3'-5' exonuclease [Peribacillus sp. NPDC094092]|uniref:3'-5' exonuclease n=1 Tax=Peribacillus sp. NPDC094092 TaxID=3390611 RepID=UPI003D023A75
MMVGYLLANRDLLKIDVNVAKEKAEPVTIIEEERRLIYVAVTRARNNLYITCPRTINNRPVACSIFLKELNLHLIDVTKSTKVVKS